MPATETIQTEATHRAHRVEMGARTLINCLDAFDASPARAANARVLEERVHALLDELKAAEDSRPVVEQVERDLQDAVRAFAALLAAPFAHCVGE